MFRRLLHNAAYVNESKYSSIGFMVLFKHKNSDDFVKPHSYVLSLQAILCFASCNYDILIVMALATAGAGSNNSKAAEFGSGQLN